MQRYGVSRNADRVLEAILALDHPTADEVYEHMRGPSAPSRATVYRNLAHLVETGRLRMREIGEQNRYDPHTEPHVHVHDVATGRLIDLPMTDRLRDALADVAADVLATQDDCIVEIRGTLR